MSLSKLFLKETKTTSLFCQRSCLNSSAMLWLDRGTCQTWGIYPELGPGLLYPWGHPVWTLFGQLILGEKAGWRVQRHLDQSDWCLIFLFCQACISLLRLPDPRAKRKTVLKVKCFKEASLIGSKWPLSAGAKTRERFQEGIPFRPLGLSQWKLSRRRVRFSPLLILMGEFPSLSAMADL